MIASREHSPEVSIIVPARNEEACLGACLESLRAQSDVDFEILVVDDGSSDRTRQIAESFASVMVLEAEPLREGWSGKSNACLTAAKRAKGKWLLFTDADTVHAPEALATALNEARLYNADLLSYSPKQEAVSFLEKAVMPVIFAELATWYDTESVNEPSSRTAAANGQYILVAREAYWTVGGHEAVAEEILEDVALAKLVKAAGRKLRFRYEGGMVRTRMYRNAGELIEGWSKNLYALFPASVSLATLRAAEFFVIMSSAILGWATILRGALPWALAGFAVFIIFYFNFLGRVRRAHFDALSTALSVFGLPIFSLLLLRSFIKHRISNQVMWKGRSYRPSQVGKMGPSPSLTN